MNLNAGIVGEQVNRDQKHTETRHLCNDLNATREEMLTGCTVARAIMGMPAAVASPTRRPYAAAARLVPTYADVRAQSFLFATGPGCLRVCWTLQVLSMNGTHAHRSTYLIVALEKTLIGCSRVCLNQQHPSTIPRNRSPWGLARNGFLQRCVHADVLAHL